MAAGRTGQVCAVEGLRDPLDRRTRGLLRRAVRDHATEVAGRRSYDAVLHLGTPAAHARLDAGAAEPGLEPDLVAALRIRAGRAGHLASPEDGLVWLTRPGPLDLQDVDARWLAAARTAYAEAGAGLVFVVVTRQGWRDPRSGATRTWARVRPVVAG